MAKKSRVRALLTATTRAEVTPTTEVQPAVVALPSQRPSSSRPSKRARPTSAEQQLVDEVESVPQSPHPASQPEQTDRARSPKWAPPLIFNDRNIKATDSVVAEKDHQLAFNLAKSVCLPKDMEHHLKQLNTEMKSIRSASKSMILALQKNNVTYRKVQELRKTTRQAMAEAEAKSAKLLQAEKRMAELEAENGRLADLVNSAEAEKQKAAIIMKDKYLRELVKLERRKDAEIGELRKNMVEAEKEGYKQGYKKAEDAYVKQCDAANRITELACSYRTRYFGLKLGQDQQTEVFNPPDYFIPKSLAEYAAALQQQFLEGSDSDDASDEDTPAENVDQPVRSVPTAEDLTVDPPSGTVAEVAHPSVNELPPETGLQVDADA
ncbi:uncharacterized protein LOC114302189, partial [Camellia sinensis]|uniref:uncharacterized protein LOC114302189 n=1 Tax=Camellia sinensis TaxID=4442 RepID=UPI001036225D